MKELQAKTRSAPPWK